MAEPLANEKTVLLIHNGELADVGAVLAQAGIPFNEAPPERRTIGAYLEASLVISSPNFLLERLRKADAGEGQRMAILEGESRTARAILSRGGVEWMVRRPVHPATLKLLVLHCLYRGPEKRKAVRVAIGAKLSLRSGMRTDTGILEDLSEQDCRVLCERRVQTGKRVKMRIPPEIAGGRSLSVRGHVVRTANVPGELGATEICLVFDSLNARDLARLRKIVDGHARGPAVLHGAAGRKRPEQDVGRSVIAVGSDPAEPVEVQPEPEQPVETSDRSERRENSRHVFERRVIAMDEQATRVLVGRDIALGGMRVNPTPTLSLGDKLQVALHVSGQDTPLVLNVEVARDDGDRGLLLHFSGLSKIAESYLREVVADLPGLSSGGEGDDDSPRVVTEIIERRKA